MSHQATAWAWGVRGLTPAQRLVLLRLADYARSDSGRAWPSMERLGADCEMSENTVRAAVHDLGERHLVAIERSRGRKTHVYTLACNPPRSKGFNPSGDEGLSGAQPLSSDPPTPQMTTPNPSDDDAQPLSCLAQTRKEPGKGSGKRTTHTRAAQMEPAPSEAGGEELPPVAAPARGGAAVEPPGFRDLWSAYPRKVARGEAVKAYARALARDGPDVIGTGLRAWVAYWGAEGTEQRFIPHPTTWLNQARYLDSPPVRAGSEPRGFAGTREYLWRKGLR